MSSTQYQRLPGFEALCHATGQQSLIRALRVEPSPPPTPMDLLVENPFEQISCGPHSQGWFNVNQEEVRRVQKALQPLNLDRDELYKLAFDVDIDRPLYEGERLSDKEPMHRGRRGSPNQRDSAVKHSRIEKRRRARHQKWQIKSHNMVSEFAHMCISNDPIYLGIDEDKPRTEPEANKTKGSKPSSKKPGKDESFCATIYSLSVCGVVLQSEHEGRKLAEARLAAAEKRVAELDRRLQMRPCEDVEIPSSSPVTARRSPLTTTRMPLSPSPTPTCSTTSHWGM